MNSEIGPTYVGITPANTSWDFVDVLGVECMPITCKITVHTATLLTKR